MQTKFRHTYKKIVINIVVLCITFGISNQLIADTNSYHPFKKQRTETYLLKNGINDYNNLLSNKQKEYINLQLQALKKQFSGGINIVLLEKIEGYDSISNYIRDFLSVNYSRYKCCDMIIFIIKNSSYVQLTAYSISKKNYDKIIPYRNEIITNIKNGIKINGLYTGITAALNILIQEFKIDKVTNELIESNEDINPATIQNNFIFINRIASVWLACATLILSIVIIFFKRISVSRENPSPDIPKITHFGVDFLYFSLLIFTISSILLLFIITYKHAVFRFLYILMILMVFRTVISRIRKGKNWARIIVTIFFLVNFALILPPFFKSIELQPIGITIIKTIEWGSELAALILLYFPTSNRWFKQRKIHKKKSNKKR